ncbi:MAG: ATP-dependent sacrificial sulfur transferase LarE [Euryarchaeota archaeon]|nr:ATP-dependent sacrificial sulfur transferase LarE [Euryarchaeota archaeon]
MSTNVDELLNSIKKQESALIAFSGGVDSSVVAALAYKALGERAIAVTMDNGLLGADDLEHAALNAAQIGIMHVIHEVDPLSLVEVQLNRLDRCYHCKNMMLSMLQKLADHYGASAIMDGSNASDMQAYRPGMRALAERGVCSPLIRCNKDEIRTLARALKLKSAERPPTACLLTRFPYNTRVTREMIERVRRAESYITAFDITQCRVRDHGGIARIEILKEELDSFIAASVDITEGLIKLGFAYVTLDLQWFRSGSIDHALCTNDRLTSRVNARKNLGEPREGHARHVNGPQTLSAPHN